MNLRNYLIQVVAEFFYANLLRDEEYAGDGRAPKRIERRNL